METAAFVSSPSLGACSPVRLSHHNAIHMWHLSSANPRRLTIIVMDRRGLTFRPTAAVRGRQAEAFRIPTSVPVRVAHELARAGYRYLDVRTPDEFSVSHPSGAVNVPYLYKVGSGITKNPDFLRQVLAHFRKHDEIIVGCESGQRSLMASTDLLSAGFTAVTNIAGRYTVWTQNAVPVEE